MQNKITSSVNSTSFVGLKIADLIWTGALLVAAVLAPAFLAHTPGNQWITGTLVNLTLFVASYKTPLLNAFLVGALPSSIALMRGLLPAPMALLIPYIISSNLILIATFASFKKAPLLGIIIASLTKFLFLYGVVLFLAHSLNNNLIFMFSWPQLATALAGGFMFLGILKAKETYNQK
jgi:hypothetical protein